MGLLHLHDRVNKLLMLNLFVNIDMYPSGSASLESPD